jgi:hypothetical protein
MIIEIPPILAAWRRARCKQFRTVRGHFPRVPDS